MDEGVGNNLRRAGSAIRDMKAHGFGAGLRRSWQRLREEGRMPPGRESAPEVATCLTEVLDDLAVEVPDQRRFEVLRRAFLSALIGDPADPDGTLAILFTKRVRQLTGEEVAVMGFAYRFRDRPKRHCFDQPDMPQNYEDWTLAVLRVTGLTFKEELSAINQSLYRNRIFNIGANWSDGMGPFTKFGVALCAFLERAEPLPAPTATAEPAKQ